MRRRPWLDRSNAYFILQAYRHSFLGNAPRWYKLAILGFLVLNPLVMLLGGPQGSAVRHQHSQHRHAQRPGGAVVPADIGGGAADSPVVRRMVWMALPYTVTLTLSGLWAVLYLL